ncbi:MAG: GGDEF domain-containing protein [Lachnospiraceae bacterium]|nr:GGDEF domain-containing protein [Lachnospiraceae bacterium]
MIEEEKNRQNPVEKALRITARIPARILAFLIGFLILAVTVTMLVFLRLTVKSFTELKRESVDYLRMSKAATDLQAGSDQLTEQVRYYAVTGDRKYLDGYFEEADVTRQRDRAIETISREAAGTKADEYLQEAMRCSTNLMEREYYAMCLVLSAQGESEDGLSRYPALRDVRLTDEDLALSADGKMEKALFIVTDESYQQEKDKIEGNTSLCMADLLGGMFAAQENTSRGLEKRLQYQTILLITLLGLFLFFILFVHFSVFSPMRRAIEYIRDNHAIPVEGGREFRFLAKALNEMRDENRRKTGQLAFESTHDPVTGVYNRTGYEQLTEQMDPENTAFLLVDVDLFKQVNDNYGHEAGDRALAEVAAALLSNFRPQDHICRIGGDEFAVLAGGVPRAHADSLVQKIGEINRSFREAEQEFPISISVGIAFGETGDAPDDLFRKADKALYEVKRVGRSGAAVYQDEPSIL